GLLGPNGSGKSTTIKILLGLLHKSTGRCSVFGKLPTDVGAKRRIGYLPEESYLYQFLNARETLDYYAKLFELDASTRARRIDELLEMVGLTAVQFRPVREYSKGMQRRIGIAQALINDPELLILDEPTTGLDPIGTRQIKDLILDLGRRGKTVILSSHLLGDVEDCVDRMVILYGGKIRAAGTCDELLEAHDRTTIETDALDDATISAIDALIRERSGGEKSVERVSKPRQKLEDLFVGIVEQARAEKLSTAGAQHGGRTAAFLRGEGEEAPASGQELISRLLTAEEPITARAGEHPTPAGPTGPDTSVIGDLLGAKEPAGESGRPDSSTTGGKPPVPPKPAPKASDVDQSVIGSLLGDDPHAGRGGTQ
ncbi:MAG TPA: ABC transporter ATP-binding protein, partial [Phycisphaerales bacterium]|nr:ABC transporter ATP-binding protein [Phycisphaerales bacterium]